MTGRPGCVPRFDETETGRAGSHEQGGGQGDEQCKRFVLRPPLVGAAGKGAEKSANWFPPISVNIAADDFALAGGKGCFYWIARFRAGPAKFDSAPRADGSV